MEPIPETTEAVEEFGPFGQDDDLLAVLRGRSERVREVVPSCIGLSVAAHSTGVTFTLVATSAEVALLDGIQYVAGGPCVAAVEADRVLAYEGRPALVEAGWELFARASAAAGVASTLTLPVLGEGRVTGSINLYAATPHAFTGHHEQLARIFDAWAPGAVTNADLPFATRALAEQAPERLRSEYDVVVAVRHLAEASGLGAEDATRELVGAAARAGVTEVQLARTIIALRRLEPPA